MRKLSLGEVEPLAWWSETWSEEQSVLVHFEMRKGWEVWWVGFLIDMRAGTRHGAPLTREQPVAGDPPADPASLQPQRAAGGEKACTWAKLLYRVAAAPFPHSVGVSGGGGLTLAVWWHSPSLLPAPWAGS